MRVLRDSDLWGGKLWRHGDFVKLWGGETISLLGAQVTDLALPTIAILSLHATVFQIGLLEALQFAAYPFLAVVAGVYADRSRRRGILVTSNLLRAGLLLVIPLAAARHTLSLWVLYGTAVAMSICRVFFDVAYQSYVPALVSRDNIYEANAKLQMSASASQVAGGPLGGALVQLTGAAAAITVNAAAFLASAVSIALIRTPELSQRPAAPTSFFADVREGAMAIVRRRSILALTLCTATMNLGAAAVAAVYFVFLYRDLHVAPGFAGIFGGVAGAGFLAGAAFAKPAMQALGLRRSLVFAAGATGVGYSLLPVAALAAPYAAIMLAVFTWSAFATVYNVNQVSFRQTVIPDRLQGRVGASMRTLVWGMIPIGNLAGGALASVIGNVGTLVAAGALVLASTAWLLLGALPDRGDAGSAPTASAAG